ncbi:RHS repeat-associated core domain-containing protein [Sanguibacter suaedae]|uniref:RHS repeat-associated core domain-containing protein n=1 Tax=Sanguibacter suaedae TaxID=2795737 RepID=A0A934I9G6_9MICO|nr:RHS repeat-associated core domain-containing protein [Sanguibacter suaedae]MBI9113670.1 RHS repeat-associated core domain-containing protein [Sanguibacter suaedae]
MRKPSGQFRRLVAAITAAVLAGIVLIAVPSPPAVAAEPWSGTVDLAVSRTQVDVHDTWAVVTATASAELRSPYYLSIYDNEGKLVSACANTACGSADNTALTASISVANNGTRTFTAYVAQDRPSTSIPTNDVRAISNTVSTHNTGWSGTAQLAVSRTQVDVHDTWAVVTATASAELRSPYYLSIYDNEGKLVSACANTACGSADNTALTASISVANNGTRTFTAYVAQDRPSTSIPTNDVRAISNTVKVRNLGWNGSVQLTKAAGTSTNQMVVTATASAELRSPYYLSIYDNEGKLVSACANTACGSADNTTLTADISVANNGTRTFTAYVAQDRPSTSIPTNDVRAISGRLSTSGNGPTWAGATAGGSNPSVPCSARCHGDPVNSVTGEFWETSTDLSVGSGSPALAFQRSFATSRNRVDGPLGWGWTTNFDMLMSVPVGVTGTLQDAGQVQVRQENGSVVAFTRTGDGRFAAPVQVQATLEQRADGTFVMTRQGRQVFVFDADGRLGALQDLNGNTVTLTYTGANLTRVTDDRGSSLDVIWAGSHITAVVDHTGRTVSYAYSSAGDLTGVTLPDGSTLAYAYDSAHRVVSLTKPGGGVTTNVYDTASRVTAQTDALGRTMTFAYESDQTTITDPAGSVTIERFIDGQVLSETKAAGTPIEATTFFTFGETNQVESTTDALGRLTRFTYDARGNRTSVTDPLGRVSTATYDELNNMTSMTNAAGESRTMAYDDRGNLVSSTAPDGATTTFTLNADGTVATSTDPLGRVTAFTYDSTGFTASITGPDGSVVLTQYDSLGNLISTTDPRGTTAGAQPGDYTSTFSYDALGRQLTGTDALGALVASVYDAEGRPTSVTDASAATTTSEYDLHGQLTAVVDAAGGRTTMTYDGAGRVLTVTDAAGSVTSSEYDALGRTTSVTDALGRVTSMEYDAGDRVTATVSPSGARTTYTYDAADQLLTVTDALGKVTTTTYDKAGRPVTVTDADGRAATSTYDKAGRPVSVLRGDGSTVRWENNAAGQVIAYVDGSGARSTTTYDEAGRRASYTDTAGRVTTYGYDVAGLLTTVTQADGAVTTYTYDAAGRRTGTDYSDATPDVSMTYDLAGRPTSTTDAAGTTAYTYDALGRVLQVDRDGTTVGYGWDEVNQLTALTYPTGQTVHRTYDAAGQLTSVKDWLDQTYTFAYDADGSTTEVTYPNGVVTSMDHDANGQTLGVLTSASAGEDLLALAYGYTDAGQLADQTTTRSTQSRAPPAVATTTSTYTWDALGRVAQVSGDQPSTFTFDAAGSVTTLGAGQTLTYDAARQLTTSTTPATDTAPAVTSTFTYDARGNRATTVTDTGDAAGTIAHTYDQANQLTTITGPDGTTTAYTYDATGLRASATTTTGTESATEQYTWNALAAVPQLLTDNTHSYLYGASSTPLAQYDLTGSGVDYLHGDVLGSIRTTTDTTGAVTSNADYDVYGQPLAVTTEPVSAITRFGYAGEYTDPTGYIYLRARYYDPTTAQFLTRDPLETTTNNPYGYTDGNPLQYVDPLGLWSWNPLKWTKDEWSTVGNVAGTLALGAGLVGVTVASGGTAAPFLLGASTVLTWTSVGASSVAAAQECLDGGSAGACIEKVGVTAVSAAGAGVASMLQQTAWQARRLAGSQLLRQYAWFGGNSVSLAYDAGKVAYCS